MPRQTKKRVEDLTVFLIADNLTDPDEILKDRDALEDIPIRIKRQLLGLLFVRESDIKRPRWVTFFAPVVDPDDIPAKSSSSGAVLLIQHGDNMYALTFGYGRQLLAPGVVDARFGLRATLNAINPDLVRSIDRRTFDVVSRLNREQMSKDSSIDDFGLDVERDLLRAVTGTPTDPTLGSRLSGMDAISLSVPVALEDLVPLLDRLHHLSERTDYKKRFKWVDNMAEVRDRSLIASLDELLVLRIRQGKTQKIWLTPPDITEWPDVAGFKFRAAQNATVYQDLTLEGYLEDCRPSRELSAHWLRADNAYCMSRAREDVMHEWTVRSCIAAEVEQGRELFVLSDGTWFSINREFAAEVDGAVDSLKPTTIPLEAFADVDEEAYNKRIAKADPSLALMDRQLIATGPGRKDIELCDLYSNKRVFLHVKRYGRSSTLSHHFAQGTVAARLLQSDSNFRKAANAKLPASHRLANPEGPLNAKDYEVAFVVVQTGGRVKELPFFSRVNLRTHYEALRSWDFGVTLTLID